MPFLIGTIPHVKRLADAFRNAGRLELKTMARMFADVQTTDEVIAMLANATTVSCVSLELAVRPEGANHQ
jgi:hypothetical protein